MPGTPEHRKLARQRAQEVITAHVNRDLVTRDRCIAEYLVETDGALLDALLAFIVRAVLEDARPDDAEEAIEGPFKFALAVLGHLIEVAGEGKREDEDVTLSGLCTLEYEESSQRDRPALRAAQACLLLHMRVRRGEAALGVQNNLRYDDMRRVVSALGDLVYTLVHKAREQMDLQLLICALLRGVETVLAGMAAAQDLTLPGFMSAYWMWLNMSDLE